MLTTYIYTFGSVVLVSLVSLVGVLSLSLKEELLRKYIFVFISLAIGALLGDAFIHLIPEALAESANPQTTSLLIIFGILGFFTIERFLHWHHHGEDSDEHVHPMGKLILVSDGVHNFIDGIIIGASFMVSPAVGMATTLAVVLHEIPQEIGDFAVLVHSGFSKKRALWLNFASALCAILGAVFVLALGEIAEASSLWFLPIAAGGFVYIAIADLIPELHKTKTNGSSFVQILTIILGVLAMLALTLLE